jgi:hypothetical protein
MAGALLRTDTRGSLSEKLFGAGLVWRHFPGTLKPGEDLWPAG